MTPWIQNVSYADIIKGHHYDAGPNSILIQIVDHDMDFPTPKHEFKNKYQFKFLDLEEGDDVNADKKILDTQAEAIALILGTALINHSNVIVHCVAGVCRSGAVAEVGVMMGFRDTETYRHPNLMVKHKLLKALNMEYNPEEAYKTTPSGIILGDLE
jgi:predicted protein tyrosine phosphatase